MHRSRTLPSFVRRDDDDAVVPAWSGARHAGSHGWTL